MNKRITIDQTTLWLGTERPRDPLILLTIKTTLAAYSYQ